MTPLIPLQPCPGCFSCRGYTYGGSSRPSAGGSSLEALQLLKALLPAAVGDNQPSMNMVDLWYKQICQSFVNRVYQSTMDRWITHVDCCLLTAYGESSFKLAVQLVVSLTPPAASLSSPTTWERIISGQSHTQPRKNTNQELHCRITSSTF